MAKSNQTFNIALFAVAFLICLLVAILMYQQRSLTRAPETDPRALAADERVRRSLMPPDPNASPTPVPEMAANGGLGLSATPPADEPHPATPATEADVAPGEATPPPSDEHKPASDDPYEKALTRFQGRTPAEDTPAMRAPIVATGLETPSAPRGPMPEIALPPGMTAPSPAVAAPTPDAFQRARNIPTRLLQTRMPIVTNQFGGPLAEPTAGGTGPELASNPGNYPAWGTSQNPAAPTPIGIPRSPSLMPRVGGSAVPSELPVEIPSTDSPGTPVPVGVPVQVTAPVEASPVPVATPSGMAVSTPAGTPSLRDLVLPPVDTPSPGATMAAPSRETDEPAPTPEPDRKKRGKKGKTPAPTPEPTPTPYTVKRDGAQVTFEGVRGALRATPGATSHPAEATPTPDPKDIVAQALKSGRVTLATPETGDAPPAATPFAAKVTEPRTPAPTPGVILAPRPDAATPPAARPVTAGGPISNSGQPSPTPGVTGDADALNRALQPGTGSGDKDMPELSPEKLAQLPPDVARKLNPLVRKIGAQVGERTLSPQDVDRRVKAALALRGVEKLPESETAKLEGFVTQDWAEKTAIASEARRQGVTVDDSELKAYREKLQRKMGPQFEQVFRKAGFSEQEITQEMRESALAEKFVEIGYQKNFDERKVREVYQATPEKFAPSRRLRVQEIYMAKGSGKDAENAIRGLRDRASRGEDFARLATQNSEAASRERGGDLGWVDADTNITSEMAQALVNLKPGQVSDVIPTAKGYRIVKLVEIEEPKPGYEGARPNVEAGIRKFLRRSAYYTAARNVKVTVNGEPVTPAELQGGPEAAAAAAAEKASNAGSGRTVTSGAGRATVRRRDSTANSAPTARQSAAAPADDSVESNGWNVKRRARATRAPANAPADQPAPQTEAAPSGFGPPLPVSR